MNLNVSSLFSELKGLEEAGQLRLDPVKLDAQVEALQVRLTLLQFIQGHHDYFGSHSIEQYQRVVGRLESYSGTSDVTSLLEAGHKVLSMSIVQDLQDKLFGYYSSSQHFSIIGDPNERLDGIVMLIGSWTHAWSPDLELFKKAAESLGPISPVQYSEQSVYMPNEHASRVLGFNGVCQAYASSFGHRQEKEEALDLLVHICRNQHSASRNTVRFVVEIADTLKENEQDFKSVYAVMDTVRKYDGNDFMEMTRRCLDFMAEKQISAQQLTGYLAAAKSGIEQKPFSGLRSKYCSNLLDELVNNWQKYK